MPRIQQIAEDRHHKIYKGNLKFKDLMNQEPFTSRLWYANLYFRDNWIKQEFNGNANIPTSKAHETIDRLTPEKRFDFKGKTYIMPVKKYNHELDNWTVFMLRESPDLLFAEVFLEAPVRH